MGFPKGLLRLRDRPLVVHHVDAFRAAGVPVRVVLGAHADEYRRVLPATVVTRVNAAWASSDPAASAWLGIHDAAVALVMPVDIPPPSAETLSAMLRAGGDAVPSFENCDGHPVRLVAPHRPGRLDHRLRGAERRAVADPGVAVDFDTPEAWEAWLRAAGAGRMP
jgi:CTP:molybdopterin cytidylyltransferase MocA